MRNEVPVKKIVATVVALLVAVGVIASASNLFEHVGADEIVVIQSPIAGTLDWYTTPGLKWQGFGSPTHYTKRSQFWFSAKSDQGSKADESIKVRFNDGAHAQISGSVAWELPTDTKSLTEVHTKYANQHGVEQQLVRTAVEKAVYMTGPLMTSKESAAERRSDLLRYIEDQLQRGVYRVETLPRHLVDPLTSTTRTVLEARIVMEGSQPARADVSPLDQFHVKTFNLSINEVGYEKVVEDQIKQQQESKMAVEIAVAQAKRAEQDALTAAKTGEANAAKAEWEQKTIAAKEVAKAQQEKMVAETNANRDKNVAETLANQKLQVAELDAKAAAQFKTAETLRGEGEAARRRKVMEADGALEKKLETYVAVNAAYAQALKDFKGNLVPQVTMNGSTGNGVQTSNATDLINMLTVKAAKDLALDLSLPVTPAPVSAPTPAVK